MHLFSPAFPASKQHDTRRNRPLALRGVQRIDRKIKDFRLGLPVAPAELPVYLTKTLSLPWFGTLFGARGRAVTHRHADIRRHCSHGAKAVLLPVPLFARLDRIQTLIGLSRQSPSLGVLPQALQHHPGALQHAVLRPVKTTERKLGLRLA